jgi:hypothetical protein
MCGVKQWGRRNEKKKRGRRDKRKSEREGDGMGHNAGMGEHPRKAHKNGSRQGKPPTVTLSKRKHEDS